MVASRMYDADPSIIIAPHMSIEGDLIVHRGKRESGRIVVPCEICNGEIVVERDYPNAAWLYIEPHICHILIHVHQGACTERYNKECDGNHQYVIQRSLRILDMVVSTLFDGKMGQRPTSKEVAQ